jgi:hypothetical protein
MIQTTPIIAAGIQSEQDALSSIHTLVMDPKNSNGERQEDKPCMRETEEKRVKDVKAAMVVKTTVVHEGLLGR